MAATSQNIEQGLKICIRSFKVLHSKLSAKSQPSAHLDYAASFANQYDRLCLWAYDVRVWKGILDEQLKQSSDLRDCISGLLSDLEEQLVLDTWETIESVVEEVTNIVDSLISLEPALRSPAPLDQFPTQDDSLMRLLATSDSEKANFEGKLRVQAGQTGSEIAGQLVPSGHQYQAIHVGAKVNFGDVYHLGESAPKDRSRGGMLYRHLGLDNPLSRLPYAEDAPFNSYSKQHEPTCLPDTRVGLLEEIYSWADGQHKQCIFWLNGLAGTGKSTIARTVARKYYDQKRLGASFFFSRGGGDVGSAKLFVTSIAMQLANDVSALRQHICEAITECSDIATRSLSDQWRQLVLGPLSKLDGGGSQSSYVLVVDALDECDDDDDIRIIVQLLAEARSLKTVRLRVFLTSRPEVPIRNGFIQMPDAEHQAFVLHNISASIVDHDISVFFENNLKLIGGEHSLGTCWPGEEVIRQLIKIAGGLFIWAATACRFIQEGLFADERVQTLLEGSTSTTAPEEHLNELYTTVLKKSIRPGYSVKEKEALYSLLRHILGSVVVLFSPLSASSLHKLLHVTKQKIDQVLKDLHAILDIPKVDAYPLRLHHPSFRDFLLDKERCKDPNFRVDEKQAHQNLADSCIRLMSRSLKQDICGVDPSGMFVANLKRSRVERSLPSEVQYACRYWIEHVQKSGAPLRDDGQIHRFLQEHFLHWLEALGWIGKVSEGVHAIASLESFATSNTCPLLSRFIHDAKRFVLYNRPAIEQAPLLTYSALVFAPTTSMIREKFKNCIPRWIRKLPRVVEKWSAQLQTLEGHSDWVNAVAFSPDGKTLASASDDETVRLWDAGSGALLQTLEGHSDVVSAVAFSPDGKTLASASHDETVRLWDAGSGALLQTLEGHSDVVSAVAFSPDGKTLASASHDETVRLWDAGSGALLQTLEGHSDWVNAVAFSPDGKTLASASDDETVRLWDAGSGALLQTLEGHSGWVNAVAFSPDGKTLASASHDKTVRLWDAGSGALLQTLDVDDTVVSLSFSDDGSSLQTDRGSLPIPSSLLEVAATPRQPQLQPSIFVEDQWVSYRNKPVLWLPPEHRPDTIAIHGGIVAFGYASGRVTTMEFGL